MLHRIRLAIQQESFLLAGEVEVDETYIGGKARNMHKIDRDRKGAGKGGTVGSGKFPVVGLRERRGSVRAEVLPDVKRRTLKPVVENTVMAGSTVYTDANRSYIGLDARYSHKTIDHAETYVDGPRPDRLQLQIRSKPLPMLGSCAKLQELEDAWN
jgi:transposase-like protein